MIYDIIGALLSFISTVFFIRKDARAWGVGLLAIGLNGWLYYQKGIFADTVLEGFYFVSTCYGGYRWLKQREMNQANAVILSLSKIQWLVIGLSVIALYLIILLILTRHTTSTIPHWDALTTALSLMAQLLMGYKIIYTWVFWFFADALYIALYWHKNLPFHACLMLFYTGMAVIGYWLWSKPSVVVEMSGQGPTYGVSDYNSQPSSFVERTQGL